MTAFSTSVPYSNSTDADYRIWGQSIKNALLSLGLVQTTDTGQVDYATVTKPASTAQLVHVTMFRFNDALQSTAPIFVRLITGSGGLATRARFTIQVGTATNGAGVLTGRTAVLATSIDTNAAVQSAAYPAYYSNGSDQSLIAAVIGEGYITDHLFCAFVIDRTRNPDGTPNGDGVYLFGIESAGTTSNPAWCYKTIPFLAGYPTPSTLFGAPTVMSPPNIGATNHPTSGGQGVDVTVFPHLPTTPKLQSPSAGVVGTFQGDFARMSFVQVSQYGALRTFLHLGNYAQNCGPHYALTQGGTSVTAAPTLHSCAIRYD